MVCFIELAGIGNNVLIKVNFLTRHLKLKFYEEINCSCYKKKIVKGINELGRLSKDILGED